VVATCRSESALVAPCLDREAELATKDAAGCGDYLCRHATGRLDGDVTAERGLRWPTFIRSNLSSQSPYTQSSVCSLPVPYRCRRMASEDIAGGIRLQPLKAACCGMHARHAYSVRLN